MENIILTNNKDLRLVSVKVGVLSTLRFELPLVSASATHVEVIVTSGNVHSAYTATFIADTKFWQCDIAASQFPAVGRQSYEVAYVLDGKQFWDGKGWIEIEDATTSGIEPQPRPEPYRYAVVSVNGYGADAQGAVRIPKTVIATDSPATTEGYMEGDIYFNRETGATWTLCNVQGTLTWVFNYKNYYTKAETEEAIDRVAAYYITYDAAGNPFPTYASLANAQTVYSGGSVRTPTRNDYCVVLADETHQGAEYRYIYAVAEGQTTGSWQPQFPVGGVMTVDQSVTKNSQNPVSGGGVWSAIWGALSALPTGFSSLYDWCVDQLAGKVPTSRTVNGKALSSDVTLTGADIAVSGTDATKISAALAGKASTADATLTPRFTEWVISPVLGGYYLQYDEVNDGWQLWYRNYDVDVQISYVNKGNASSTSVSWSADEVSTPFGFSATRTALSGYVLGSQSTKPLASEAEAEALRTGKQDALSTQQLANIAAVPNKADKVADATAGNLAALDASGNPTDSTIPAANVALKGEIPYALGMPIVIDSESVQTDTTDPDNPITYAEVTLANRTANIVQIYVAIDELRVTLPAATDDKMRDFELEVGVGDGTAALAAPALSIYPAEDEDIALANPDGAIPELADGTATLDGSTVLYFTEFVPYAFLVKGEQLKWI